jgi:hypothetical protein
LGQQREALESLNAPRNSRQPYVCFRSAEIFEEIEKATDMRAMFDETNYGWIHHDNSFEPVSMPKDWRPPDYRGQQIEYSREKKGYVCEHSYDGDQAVTQSLKNQVSEAFMEGVRQAKPDAHD